MMQEPLLEKGKDTDGKSKENDQKKEISLEQISLIRRYNIFIENYNNPKCIVDAITLDSMPDSDIYNKFFIMMHNNTKFIYFLLLNVPVINCFLFLVCAICVFIYFKCLAIHDRNVAKIIDPFKNMVYDPEMCFTLHKDYYFFTIEFKQLQGFSLNYNKEIRKELNLREERGKANFMVYNSNFWTSYNNFGKWKNKHIFLLVSSLFNTIIANVIFFVFMVDF